MGAFSAWAAFTSAVAEQRAYKEAGQRALDNLAEMYLRTQQDTKPYLARGSVAPNYPARKCPSCGSREFRHHAGARICSYCRSEG